MPNKTSEVTQTSEVWGWAFFRQLTDSTGTVTLAKSYAPYGTVTAANGSGQSAYGFTGEMTDVTGLTYLRARYYSPLDGRFMSRDTWGGNYNRPLSLNRWMYVEGNPVNLIDPSGNSPETASQVLGQALAQYANLSSTTDILTIVNNCLPAAGIQVPQYDLTGYLALAMTMHGQDWRVKAIASSIVTADVAWATSQALIFLNPPLAAAEKLIAGTLYLSAYAGFYFLEATKKEWDIKQKIKDLSEGIVLCGTGNNCDWFDYSTPGNIHFGYIAGLALINHYVAAVAGGVLEQRDIRDELAEMGVEYDAFDCFKNNRIDQCDNPQDQAAVDFGYYLASTYGSGITDAQLRFELDTKMGDFQRPPDGFITPHLPYPETNYYGADDFNY